MSAPRFALPLTVTALVLLTACGSAAKVARAPGTTAPAPPALEALVIDPYLGPPPSFFDCTWQRVPAIRRAAAPLGCVLDLAEVYRDPLV